MLQVVILIDCVLLVGCRLSCKSFVELQILFLWADYWRVSRSYFVYKAVEIKIVADLFGSSKHRARRKEFGRNYEFNGSPLLLPKLVLCTSLEKTFRSWAQSFRNQTSLIYHLSETPSSLDGPVSRTINYSITPHQRRMFVPWRLLHIVARASETSGCSLPTNNHFVRRLTQT